MKFLQATPRLLRHSVGIGLLSIAAFVCLGSVGADTGPDPVRFDFARSESLRPWQTWMSAKKVPDGVEIRLPGTVDQNHLDGIGPIYLIAHLPMSEFLSRGESCDLRGAEVVVEARTKDLDLAGGRACWWIVSDVPARKVDPGYLWQQTNWACTGHPLPLVADCGEQPLVSSTTLPADPSFWTYAGTADMTPWAGRYIPFPLAPSLANVNASLHLVVLGCQPDRLPSGSITLRSIEIRRAMPSVNPTEAEVERAVLSGDWVAARAVLERAAAAGQAGAAFHLGNALKFGFGGPVDFSRALAYYAAAADDEPEAAIEQADLLAKGLGVKQDYPAAMRLLSQERVRGIPRAQYLLGMLHWRGRGTPVDLAGARDLLESAAAHGQVAAMVPAGIVCLELGDVDQAYRWLSLVKARHAASLGSMMDFVNHRIAALSRGMPEAKRSALDSDIAAWPARQFSAAKHPG